MNDLTDEQLMERIVAGDQRAFEALHARHDQLVRGHIKARCALPSLIDDIAQIVWTLIWQTASGYDPGRGVPAGWISIIAQRKTIDILRKGICYERVLERMTQEHRAHCLTHGELDTPDPAHELDTRAFLAAARELLPPAQWQALDPCFLQGMSQREVMRHTGIPFGTIKTRCELALRKLRSLLSQQDLPCARTTARDARPSIRNTYIVPGSAGRNGHTRRSRPSGRAGAALQIPPATP